LSELEYLIHVQFRFCFVPLNAIYFDVVILPKQGQMGTIWNNDLLVSTGSDLGLQRKPETAPAESYCSS
jgi:hypothetical protein